MGVETFRASSHRPVATAAALAACLAGCPQSAGAIVGPSSDAPALAPVVIMVLQRSGATAGFCSGIVLAPRIVLTAAHCAPAGAELRVHYKDADGKPVLLPVMAAARHPGYRADAVRTRERSIDLALLRLPDDLPERFRTAAIGTMDRTTAGTVFEIAGFGVTRENEGASSGRLRMTDLAARAPLSSLLLWAEDPNHTASGACTGDSGGPVLDPATRTVEAIILWAAGEGGSRCGSLTQALWLAPHRAWIRKVIGGWGVGP